MGKKKINNIIITQDETNDLLQRVSDLEYTTQQLINDNIQLAQLSSALKCLVNMYECDIIELQDKRFFARLRRFFAPLFGSVK
jgi:hypothetical protein